MMVPTVILISIISFVIIQLPPGDFLSTYIASLEQRGMTVDESRLAALRQRYGLGEPIYVQYVRWVTGLPRGHFGFSFEWNRPVRDLIGQRLGLTVAVSLSAMIFSWVVAFPIGIYAAFRKNSFGDHFFTFLGFVGLSIPNFMLALVLMYIAFKHFGMHVGGLFSPEYAEAAWSVGKAWDLLRHIWMPMVVVGTAGTAGLIRVMRNNLLDELGKPYVVTARAKGVPEAKLLVKYPVRLASNPFISTVGWSLPLMVSGEVITAVVLNLPTTGPLLLRALQSQDMYLAGTLTLFLAILTVIGTLVSDILLALLDPRIRY